MKELYSYLLPYYEQGLDAVIVQDMGVFSFVKRHFPDLDVHASTQMTVTGAPGAALIGRMGASRIVTARELSLEEIEEIYRETGAEIEALSTERSVTAIPANVCSAASSEAEAETGAGAPRPAACRFLSEEGRSF